MRIAICGAQATGKSTLIDHFVKKWTNYEVITSDYRQKIKDLGLKINREGNKESQKIIRDSIADSMMNNADKQYTIHDRSMICNLSYSLYLADKGKLKDTDFIADSINICRYSNTFLDIIFWLPLNEFIPVDNTNPNRDNDETFRYEIDNIFYGIFESYKKNDGLFFIKDNQPAMIELQGRSVNEKMEEISQYLSESGDVIETDGSASVFNEMSSFYDREKLLDEVKTGIPRLF